MRTTGGVKGDARPCCTPASRRSRHRVKRWKMNRPEFAHPVFNGKEEKEATMGFVTPMPMSEIVSTVSGGDTRE